MKMTRLIPMRPVSRITASITFYGRGGLLAWVLCGTLTHPMAWLHT